MLKRLFLFLSILILIIGGFSFAQNPELKVIFFNVGDGDSILIQTPNKRVILIDGGTCAYRDSPFDAAEEVILPFLKKEGISKIDTMILTHGHSDHVGGLVTILEKGFPVGEVLESGIRHTSYTYQRFLQAIEDRGIPYHVIQVGDRLSWGKGIEVEVLSPLKPFFETHDALNNNSLVLRLTYHKVSLLFTADITWEAEERLVKTYREGLRATILKVPHHGRATSNTIPFVNAVHPEIAIISCGQKTRSHLLEKVVLPRYQKVGGKVLQTDEDGTITITTDGTSYRVKTSH